MKPLPSKLDLSWNEIGLLCEGLSLSSRPFHQAIQGINEEYDLGPRGAWVIAIIAPGLVSYPHEVAEFFRIGRSLITAELNRLTEAGLIIGIQNAADRRRTRLELTPAGEAVFERVKQALSTMVAERFAGYSREELLLCARMLRDFRMGPAAGDSENSSTTP